MKEALELAVKEVLDGAGSHKEQLARLNEFLTWKDGVDLLPQMELNVLLCEELRKRGFF